MTIKANYEIDALAGVISAASKIIAGKRDQETADASREETHPIAKAMAPVKEAGDGQYHTIDSDGNKGKLVDRNDDGTVTVDVQGKGNVKMSASSWSAKVRRYAEEGFWLDGEIIEESIKIVHEKHGEGIILPNTQKLNEEKEIVTCDVLFSHGIEQDISLDDIKEAVKKEINLYTQFSKEQEKK